MARSNAVSREGSKGSVGKRSRDLNTGRQKRYNASQQKRSLISIFIIGLFVVSAFAAVVLYAFPGDEGTDNPIYGIQTFIYNPSHEAEKGGGADFMLYVKNTGNVRDTFMMTLQNNSAGFTATFQPEEVKLKQGASRVIIVRTTAPNSGNGHKTASVAVQSQGNYKLIQYVPFEVNVVESQGSPVTADDKVGMWYIGSLVEGTLFDSNVQSVVQNDSIPQEGVSEHFDIFDMSPSIQEAGVIEGWKESAVGMKLGQSIVVSLPPEKAYGPDPEAHRLGGKTLIFEMTLGKIY